MAVWQKRIEDEDGNGFTVYDMSMIFGISKTYINELLRKHKTKSLREFVEIWKLFENNRRPPIYIMDEAGDKHNLKQVGALVGRSKSWVLKVYKRYNLKTLEEYKQFTVNPSSLRKDPNIATKALVKPIEFSRGKVCYRHNFMLVCIHYTSCADSRSEGKHHERYKTDGTCFDHGEEYDGRYYGYEAFEK